MLRAELTREEVADPLPALTGNTLVSLEVLHEACAATRERGCAAEVEESAPGVRCVAAVVPCRLPGTDAISCSMPVDQTTDAQARETGEPLAEATTDLAHRLRRAGIR
ncbi:IclR family transcriptional regulator domain-containing protein [Saccharopolyspora hordei]|uniref:DNA-binding IclR family transcriptional regulator n=1 Tax=Saccharopolyspora hordei TaxID=1838 RepID=A0A853AP22_9PSEU|nr:DNA-binding IclR family transcriptional regulator [Saccharopolyspora hordei]